MTDSARIWLALLLAVWALAYGYSFVTFAMTQPDGDGFTRGANRVTAFLGWQAIAGLVGLGIWGFGWRWPKGSGVRRIAAVPILLALFLLLSLAGFYGWAMTLS